MPKGWKTITGAAIMAVSVFIAELGYAELAEAFRAFALALMAVGIGHKIEKASK